MLLAHGQYWGLGPGRHPLRGIATWVRTLPVHGLCVGLTQAQILGLQVPEQQSPQFGVRHSRIYNLKGELIPMI